VADIVITQTDDADADGISNADETVLGTDGLNPDSDGDGLLDGEERALFETNAKFADSDSDGQDDGAEITAGTDPGDALSVLAIKGFSRVASGIEVRWQSVRGKSYRVLRSGEPDFASYDVLAADMVATGPMTSYMDPTANVATGRRFYRIEVDDSVVASVADSDGDGVTDADEIAVGSDPGRYDTDRDGIGDGEEILVLNSSPVKTDTDGDGSSDWAELVAGTNPANPSSVLAITAIERDAAGNVVLRWAGVAGRTYRVLRSATPGFESYEVLANAWPGNAPVTAFIDSGGGAAEGRFYRVVVE
jgi:hypothetical protein